MGGHKEFMGMSEEEWAKTPSYVSYDDLYKQIEAVNFDPKMVDGLKIFNRELYTQKYPEISWVIEYFSEQDEFEKCKKLSDLQKKLESMTS